MKDCSEPAFPNVGAVNNNQCPGMTLRDYFAAKAMVRLTGADPDGIHSADTLAALSYRLADAMLKARAA